MPEGLSVLQIHKDAVISEDGRYRYLLERRWGSGKTVLFVMLNPSTADASVDDPTIRRCMTFARSWGFDGLCVWNIYAYRATDPLELELADDPIGAGNEDWVWRVIPLEDQHGVDLIVLAWGAKPARGKHVNRSRSMLLGPFYDHDVYCLGRCKNGEPRHPLYVKGGQLPEMYSEAGTEHLSEPGEYLILEREV